MSQTVRMQHLIPATLVLVLAGTVTWLSFTREPADAFLFPRIISVAMILLALWNFARAALGLARVGAGFTYTQLLRLLPGVVVMCIYVFFAARWLGFYTASLITFITIFALYDPAPHNEVKSWLKRVIVAAAFIAIMYLLFAVLLKVQTPRGPFL